MYKNTQDQYGCVTKILHWIMAILFIAMFLIAYVMLNIPKSDFRLSLYDMHKSTGLLLLALVVLRLGWKYANLSPDLPVNMSVWQKYAAHGNIICLYLLMLAMPITGMFTSMLSGHDITFYYMATIKPFLTSEIGGVWFSNMHYIFSLILIAIFLLHVAAALHHHFFKKDNILKRMLF